MQCQNWGVLFLSPLIKAQTAIAENNVEMKAADISEEDKAKLKTKNKEQKEIVEKSKSEIAGKIKVVDEAENAGLIKDLIMKHWNKEAQKTASLYNAKAKPGQKIEAVNIEAVIACTTKVDKPEKEEKGETTGDTPSETIGKRMPVNTPKDTDVYKKLGKSEYNLMKKVYQVLNSEKRLDDKTKEKIKTKLVKKILEE